MAEKKKQKTVDDIVADYQKFHNKTGKKFGDRIKKFEELHDPDNMHRLQFAHHAHYTMSGKPGKDYPGAINSAHKVLDKHAAGDNDIINDTDKLAEILESYADTILQKSMNSDRIKGTLKHAKEEAGLDDKELRELKGTLLAESIGYTDERGNPINILSDSYIKRLKGKKGQKKIKLVEHLKNLSEKLKDSYTNHLTSKALEGLISQDDQLEMAKYIAPKFLKRGLKPGSPHITRSAGEQASHYAALLQGGTQTLIEKAGYKPMKQEEEKKKK